MKQLLNRSRKQGERVNHSTESRTFSAHFSELSSPLSSGAPQQELSRDWTSTADSEAPYYATANDVDSEVFWGGTPPSSCRHSSSDGYLHPVVGAGDFGMQSCKVTSN